MKGERIDDKKEPDPTRHHWYHDQLFRAKDWSQIPSFRRSGFRHDLYIHSFVRLAGISAQVGENSPATFGGVLPALGNFFAMLGAAFIATGAYLVVRPLPNSVQAAR